MRPQVRPSSAAQYGATLAQRRQEIQRAIQAAVTGYGQVDGRADPLQPTGLQDRLGAGLDPRMGYGAKYAPPTFTPGPYNSPVVKSPFDITLGSPLGEDFRQFAINQSTGALPGGVDPHESPEASPSRHGENVQNYYEDQTEIYTQSKALMEQALAELEYQRNQLAMKRDQALANARADIAAQYDEQIAQVNEDISVWQGNLADLNERVPFTLSDTGARFEQARLAALNIVENAGADLTDVKNKAMAGIEAGYDSAVEGLVDELNVIGAGDAATAALTDVVVELEQMAYDTVGEQSVEADQLLAAAERVAVTMAESVGITNEVEIRRFAETTEAQIKDSITRLMDQRKQLEEAKSRAFAEAERAINEQFSEAFGALTYQDQLEFATSVVGTSMEQFFNDADFDVFEKNNFFATFEDLLGNGVTNLTQFQNYVGALHSRRNQLMRDIAAARSAGDPDLTAALQDELAGLPALDNHMVEGLEVAFSLFTEALREWENNQPKASDTGFSGTGTGATNTDPANIAAAKAGEGVYGARVRYTAQIGQEIAARWTNVEVQGANYFRPVGAVGGGQVQNSDHKTAGALDIMINPQNADQMRSGTQIMAYLRSLPGVAYIIWEPNDPSNAHYNHIHVSFALGGGHHTEDGHDHGEGGSGGGGGAKAT